jgi:hypothetical protein
MDLAAIRNGIYNHIKPALPRAVQIALRRQMVRWALPGVADRWPIYPGSGLTPAWWRGWPSGARFALVLTHDVEHERGVARCLQLARMEREMGLVSSFNFVPERYAVPTAIRDELVKNGFEVGVHDLRHDGKLYQSQQVFMERARRINSYLKQWGAVGFRSGSMYHNLDWLTNLDVEYDASTFDTDPFEPQSDGVRTIFPMWVANSAGDRGYVELPYTLAQDMTLFVILQHDDSLVWEHKIEWIAANGGMALLDAHPDYMRWDGERPKADEYPVELYRQFLAHVQRKYRGQYWNAVPREVARHARTAMAHAAQVGP